MRKPAPLLVAALLAFACCNSATAVTPPFFVWTGQPPTNFKGGAIPLFDGTEDFLFGTALRRNVVLTGSPKANYIFFTGVDNYTFTGSGPVTLGVNAMAIDPAGFLRVDIASNINLLLNGPAEYNAGASSIVMRGQITGTGDLTLLGTFGAFIFNHPSGNTYTGNTTIGDGTSHPIVAFWNSSPFGTGTVTLRAGGELIGHNTPIISNNLVFGSTSPGTIAFRTWDDTMTFTGGVTLANNMILQARLSPLAIEAQDDSGSLPRPGPSDRHAVRFTGVIGEQGGARSLTVGGPGIVILEPSAQNTYSGGTTVNGSLILANDFAAPNGTNNITVNVQGYVGIGDLTAGNFADEVSTHISKSSTGAIGVDTLPGNSTVVFTDNIDLSLTGMGFASTNTLRLGTATSAILTGTIKPQGNNYLFGNGGGSLYVESDLGDQPLLGSQVILSNNSFVPLKLYLRGNNSYTGKTLTTNGFIIIDGGASLPISSSLVAGSTNSGSPSTAVGTSYIGMTPYADLSASTFFSRFDKPNTWGVVGFDTRPADSTFSVSGVDLSAFNDGVFLGTSSRAIITGTIIPTAVPNANNAANTLRLTAGNGGELTVASTLADLGVSTPLSVMIGTAFNPNNGNFSDGTVILSGTNTYTGGTTINPNSSGITAQFTNNSAFGTGPIQVVANGPMAGLEAGAAGLTLSNNISFSGGTGFGYLALTGDHDFTIAGAVSGTGTFSMYNLAPRTFTFSGDNSGFFGNYEVRNGRLMITNNAAMGHGITFLDTSGTLEFGGAATAPTIRGIDGNGTIIAPNGTVVTFDISDADNSHDFEGVISGPDATVSSASIVVTSSNPESEMLYLAGNNQFSGGVSITGNAVLGLGHNNSAGSGTVTVNAPDGGLALNTGVTFSNTLDFQAGALAGFGTFDPVNLATIEFSNFRSVIPGLGGLGDIPVGKLTLQANGVFGTSGGYAWNLQDADDPDGFSQLLINGDLNISATDGLEFIVEINTFDASGVEGMASLTMGQAYSLPIVTVTGAITGFAPESFTILSGNFQNGIYPQTEFSLSLDGTQKSILLNFTPVPEPSTYALMALGLAFVGATVWRRRRGR
jgi:hypothetical protein